MQEMVIPGKCMKEVSSPKKNLKGFVFFFLFNQIFCLIKLKLNLVLCKGSVRFANDQQ